MVGLGVDVRVDVPPGDTPVEVGVGVPGRYSRGALPPGLGSCRCRFARWYK